MAATTGAAKLMGAPQVDEHLHSALASFPFAFTVSDPTKPDNPIVYASKEFYDMTGYTPEETLGHNCRFLQGPETSRQKVMEIRDAIREVRSSSVCLLNYRKDGSSFWNQFYICPILKAGVVQHYIGIQTDVTALVQREQQQATGASPSSSPPQPFSPVGMAHVIETEASEAEELGSVLRRVSLQAGGASRPCHSSLPGSLLQALVNVQQSFVLADPSLPDCPIVHASDAFLRLTGYSRREVLGRNCRFLQGPATDPQALARLRTAIAADPPAPVTVTLLNYRKDGAPFYNCLHIAPIRDAAGRVSYLAGIQLDVSRADASRGAAAAASAAASGGNADALLPQAPPAIGMQQKLVHNGVTGALRLAVRSVSGKADLRRSIDYQGLPVDRHTAMHHGSLHPHHSAPVPLPTASGNPCASEPQQEHLPQRSRSDLH